MAAQELVARGDRCFVEEEYDNAAQAYSEVRATPHMRLNRVGAVTSVASPRAVSLYWQALQLEPSNARVLEARANAYIKLEQYQEANADATMALELDPQLAKAYLRKG